MSTIPLSQIVNVTPSVLAAGGSALDLNGLLLSSASQIPIGTVPSFADADAVSEYFGATSLEAALAAVYFNGFDNSPAKPGALLMAQYPTSAVGAYLRGADVSTFTTAQLQALSGGFGVTIDGVLKSSGSISLAAATGFSSAASIIGNALAIHGPQVSSFTGSIAGGTMTVTAVASGTVGVGQVLSGTGVTANTCVTGLLSGTGAAGTYSVSSAQTAASQAITGFNAGVSYDSVSGGFLVLSGSVGSGSSMTFGSGTLATSLKLTEALGAVLSQGTAAATPGAFMTALKAVSQNWALFTTTFDPDSGSGTPNRAAFASWANDQNARFGYVPWDTDASPTTTVPATSSLGYAIDQANYAGSAVVYSPDASIAVFVLGIAASIDFERANGRTDFTFRHQAGITASVTDGTVAQNLLANGYNFYGAYGSGSPDFVWFQDGSVSGAFAWLDSFVDQIWLNNAFLIALATLLDQALSIPYNSAGNAMISAALADPINAGVNFGAIRAGVELSSAQRAAVNGQAGVNIADTIEQVGWYLQVLPASAAVRAARASPPATFWYTDGQSVQQISLSSVAIQ